VENYALRKTEAARKELAQPLGVDGQRLLHAIDAATDQEGLRHVPAVVTLRRRWGEPAIEEGETWRGREVKARPAAAGPLASPDEPAARDSTQRAIEWVGNTGHRTATCAADTPHLVGPVETTPATPPDGPMAAVVQQSLRGRTLLPREHVVAKGYTEAQMVVDSEREDGVTIAGPVAEDPGWQGREGTGFDTSQLGGDWERPVVTCPAGKPSISWHPQTYPASGMAFAARFARQDCTPWTVRARCTRAKIEPRIVGLQVREHYEALQTARKRQTTQAFHQPYAARSGRAATPEQAGRRCGLRRSRSMGWPTLICNI
jgi:transposase